MRRPMFGRTAIGVVDGPFVSRRAGTNGASGRLFRYGRDECRPVRRSRYRAVTAPAWGVASMWGPLGYLDFRSAVSTLQAAPGAVAQLGERCNRTAEVRGSIPLS